MVKGNLSTNGTDSTRHPYASKWTQTFTLYHMQQSYLDVMPKTIKCLEKNIGEKLCDIHVGEGFFGITHTHTHTHTHKHTL